MWIWLIPLEPEELVQESWAKSAEKLGSETL
jgi:hypothetical protein